MKKLICILALLVLISISTACNPISLPAESTKIPLPTAKVPPVSLVDEALQRWRKSQTIRYFLEIEERSQAGTQKIRLVVSDGIIRAAQRLYQDKGGKWGEPVSIPLQEARAYTVEGLLERVRLDILGSGVVPFNMQVSFDASLGIPTVVHAEALPVYNEAGAIVIKRQSSYDLVVSIKALLEESYTAGRDAILILTRSGGQSAWCDSLYIFADGSSMYTDDCRQVLLQLDLPASRLAQLGTLRYGFASLDDLVETSGETLHLVIVGTGEGSPDELTKKTAWELASLSSQLLSKPIGLGLTALFIEKDRLYGLDVFKQTSQPARFYPQGTLYGIAMHPEDNYLAFSDEQGLRILNLDDGNLTTLLPSPTHGLYQPRLWASGDILVVSHQVEPDGGETKLGWVSLTEKTWHDMPVTEGVAGYGCDTGLALDASSGLLAITGLGYGHPCNTSPGLTIINLQTNQAKKMVAPAINPGISGAQAIIAGAYTPAWSADGEWLAFGLDQDAQMPLEFTTRLYRIRVDGNDLAPLTNNWRGMAAYPVYDPDGKLYYSLVGVGVEEDGIYRYDPVNNTHLLLIPGAELHPLSISPDGNFLLYEHQGHLLLWGFLQEELLWEWEAAEGESLKFVGWMGKTEP